MASRVPTYGVVHFLVSVSASAAGLVFGPGLPAAADFGVRYSPVAALAMAKAMLRLCEPRLENDF